LIREGQNTKAAQSANLHSEITLEKAAGLMNVSRRSAAAAKRLKEEDPIAFEEVKAGKISLHAATKPEKVKPEDRVGTLIRARERL
jgi:hypothetical protein